MQSDNAASTAEAHSTHFGKWIGSLSAIVTIGLTLLNGYWSHRINQTDADLKIRANQLDEKRLELEAAFNDRRIELERLNFSLSEGKERMARYEFVQGLFESVLNEKDIGRRTLAVNLINLALPQDEATKLFVGLQASNDRRTQELGNIGSDLVGISNLVSQMDAAAKESRVGAVDILINKYRADSRAVEQALSLLEMPKLARISMSGRINVLIFLRNTEKEAWTPSLIERASNAIEQIRQRHESKVAEAGPQTQDALGALEEHLKAVIGRKV